MTGLTPDQALVAIGRLGYPHHPDQGRRGGLGLTTCPRCGDPDLEPRLLLTLCPDGQVAVRCLDGCDHTVLALLATQVPSPTDLDLARRRRLLRAVGDIQHHQARDFWSGLADKRVVA